LKRELVGHDARTVPEMGWASKRNGELLALAAGESTTFARLHFKFWGLSPKRRAAG
jgi:hypothetical protein